MKAILAHCPSAFVSDLALFERHWLREAYFEQEISETLSLSLLQPDWNQSWELWLSVCSIMDGGSYPSERRRCFV